MVAGYVQEHVFRHPWERVTAANSKKYADLEHRRLLSHVVDVNVVNKSVDQEGGQLLTTRAITVNIPVPWWVQRVVGTNTCRSLEESILDNDKRSLEMVTRNVTLKDFVDVEEKCSYLPHPENPEWTLLRQQTSITCTSGPALQSVAETIEQRCAEKFQQNSQRGREVVESVCRALESVESTAVATQTTATEKAEPLLVSSQAASQVTSQSSSSSSTRRPSNFIMRKILERAELVERIEDCCQGHSSQYWGRNV